MKLKHGDKVKYIGRWHDRYLTPGKTYTVFGHVRSANPDENGVLDKSQPRQREATISIRVDDPDDDFGGVLSILFSDVEPVEEPDEPPIDVAALEAINAEYQPV